MTKLGWYAHLLLSELQEDWWQLWEFAEAVREHGGENLSLEEAATAAQVFALNFLEFNLIDTSKTIGWPTTQRLGVSNKDARDVLSIRCNWAFPDEGSESLYWMRERT